MYSCFVLDFDILSFTALTGHFVRVERRGRIFKWNKPELPLQKIRNNLHKRPSLIRKTMLILSFFRFDLFSVKSAFVWISIEEWEKGNSEEVEVSIAAQYRQHQESISPTFFRTKVTSYLCLKFRLILNWRKIFGG